MPDSVRRYSCNKRNFKKKKKGSDPSVVYLNDNCKMGHSAALWKQLAKSYPEVRRRLDTAEKGATCANGCAQAVFSANNESFSQSKIAARKQGRVRAFTVIAAPTYQNSPKRQRSSVKKAAVRRATQSLTSMAVRKTPILPVRWAGDENNGKHLATTGRKISVTPVKRARRCSEPYLFTTTGKWRKASTLVAPGKAIHANNYKRRLSTTAALLPGANKIKLQELAKDELLASLNEPFDKDVPEQDAANDKDVVDYAAIEEQDEMVQLTALKRVKVIEEIFETEKKYIFCLDTLDKVFRAPMLLRGIAQEKDINALFPSCLSTIKECHSWFMEQLENRIKCDEWQGSIGDILGKMAGPLKDNLLNVYTDYVNSFPKSISTFSKCTRTSTKFRRFIENCYEKSDNLDLPSYLITPVQRLPRYVLLLRQLSKYTRDDHPDNDSVKSALLQMEELICSLNGSIQSSMQVYTARESETRKSIRRQLSRRRKKPRPVTLTFKDTKAIDEKSEKSAVPSASNNVTPRHSENGMPQISPDIEETPIIQEENKENENAENQGSPSDMPSASSQLSSQPQPRPPSPVALRKNKLDNRKSLRRSIGAALSSFWSPKDEKDLKDIHEDFKSQPNARRKYGVSYNPSSPNLSGDPMPSKSSEDGIKRRRFSNSFREKTRSFRIQMRRRSGTWFSTTEEHKASGLDFAYNPSLRPETPPFIRNEGKIASDASPVHLNNSKGRSGTKGTSLISLFSKRKSKLVSDDVVGRRRSDSDRELNLTNNHEHQILSVSLSVPSFPHARKDSKALSISSSICEESLESDTDHCTSLSTIEDETTKNINDDNFNGHIHTPASDTDSELKISESVGKKPKKGKLMKTLRQFMSKGKN